MYLILGCARVCLFVRTAYCTVVQYTVCTVCRIRPLFSFILGGMLEDAKIFFSSITITNAGGLLSLSPPPQSICNSGWLGKKPQRWSRKCLKEKKRIEKEVNTFFRVGRNEKMKKGFGSYSILHTNMKGQTKTKLKQKKQI